MSPRRYRMDKARGEEAERTRLRILEATLRLHSAQGILGTSWRQIAEAADVSVSTVYKHFPSLDALVPACGELLAERYQPPGPHDIAAILSGSGSDRDRLERVARTLFAFYERAGASIEVDPRERTLPAIREWEAFLAELVAGFVAAALPSLAKDDTRRMAIAALLDPPTFTAMRKRGLPPEVVLSSVVGMAVAWLEKPQG